MDSFLKLSRKFYFSYPCPRKLREIVQMSLFEKENKEIIKEIWKKHYETKPNIFGVDLDQHEMKKVVEKYYTVNILVGMQTLFSSFL